MEKTPGLRPRRARLLAMAVVVLATIVFGAWLGMIRMPGKSFSGPLPAWTPEERTLATGLRTDVEMLATEIGERRMGPYQAELDRAADFVFGQFMEAGYQPTRHTYTAHGMEVHNIEVVLTGNSAPDEIVIVGAHYDSEEGTPAANDNGSGVAALLALGRRMAGRNHKRTLRFVAFVNEESPHFHNGTMGSQAYARRCRQRNDNVVAMLSLETMGYFRDAPGTQAYPWPLSAFYPDRGNFIAFVGNFGSRALVHRTIETFRRTTAFPSEGGALPAALPGVGWSDHRSFWEQGYSAIMLTDTAPFRYPHYHRPTDTPDKIDYERLARVTLGVERVATDLLTD